MVKLATCGATPRAQSATTASQSSGAAERPCDALSARVTPELRNLRACGPCKKRGEP